MSDHVMDIGQSFLSGDWSVGCSCGWSTDREHPHRSDAVEDWDTHYDMVLMAAAADMNCGNPWGVMEDCSVGLDGHTCVRPNLHEGRCRCRCRATTTYKDPIYEDDEELDLAREALDG